MSGGPAPAPGPPSPAGPGPPRREDKRGAAPGPASAPRPGLPRQVQGRAHRSPSRDPLLGDRSRSSEDPQVSGRRRQGPQEAPGSDLGIRRLGTWEMEMRGRGCPPAQVRGAGPCGVLPTLGPDPFPSTGAFSRSERTLPPGGLQDLLSLSHLDRWPLSPSQGHCSPSPQTSY